MDPFRTSILEKFRAMSTGRGHFVTAIAVLCISCVLAISVFIFARSPAMQNLFHSSKCDSILKEELLVENEDVLDTSLSREDSFVPVEEDCQFSDEILSMAKGVDITKLDLFPVSLKGIEGNPGIMAQLIKLTCERKFTKLDSNGNLISRIPDQFVPNSYETMSAFGTSTSIEERTERNTRDSKAALGLTVGIDVLKLGMFSSSASYERKRQQMAAGESYISEMNAFYIVRTAEFRSPKSRSMSLEGNEDFQNVVDNLPPMFEEDPSAYLDLLAKYGTHYFAMARFGGFVKVTTEVTKQLRSAMSEDEIQAKLKASYKVFFKGSMDFEMFENSTSKQFRGMTSSSKYSHGGDPSLAFSGDVSKWISSVPKTPRLIGGKLQPITNLISNQTKALALQKAIDVYLGMAYVRDLKVCLKIFRQKNIGDLFHQNRLLILLKRLTLEQLEDQGRLNDLGTQVTQSLHIPTYGRVIVNIFRGGPVLIDERVVGPQCTWIDVGIFADNGNRTHEDYLQIYDFQTAAVPGTNPEWNEQFEMSFEFKIAIQFCKRSKNCSSDAESIGVSNGGFKCDIREVFIPPNRYRGIQNTLYLNDFKLIYNIYWEPLPSFFEQFEQRPV